MLKRLGIVAHARRRVVVAAWLAAIIALAVAMSTVGSKFSTQFNLPDVESAQGFDLLAERFGGEESGRSGTLVVQAEQGFTNAQRDALNVFFAQLDARDDMRIVSPFSPEGARQVSPTGTIAFATVTFPAEVDAVEEFAAIYEEMKAIEPVVDGVQIEYGGEVFAEFEAPTSEVLGLAFAIVILIFAFGSVLAMGLPIGTAFGGIGVGVLVVTLASNLFTIPDVATTLGVMIGLGVGIDYALFIVTRYREARRRGESCEAATAESIDTAGRAVLFAGTTVVISLLGMLIMSVSFMNGLAIGASITVLFTMLASVTLLPALLGFVGDRVEVTRWRGIVAAGLVAVSLVGYGLKQSALLVAAPLAALVLIAGSFVPALRRPLAARRVKPMNETSAYRWSRVVQRRPWVSVIVGTGALLALALPVLDLRLGFADEGNYPADTTTKRAYDLLAEGFGPGFNGPLTLVAAIDTPEQLAAAQSVSQALASTPGVAFASPAVPNDAASPSAVLWTLYPTSAPQSEEAANLVSSLRDTVLPQAVGDSSLAVKVTGSVAVNVDFSGYLADRLPTFFAVVLALSFVLLMAVFRSLLVPLKAVIMNLLSIGSAYGAVVAVFQWGWGSSLVGLGGSAPIDPWLPVMMFAIVFGLSMDYEVFLLSRVKEEYDRTGDNELAVADGLANTARVITAAAAIMVFVFGSFVLEPDRSIKMFGFGLAVAVFLDATIVRMLLVPATMELLGDRNWWLPRWLERLLPKIDVEGSSHAEGKDGADPDFELEVEAVLSDDAGARKR
ncbi:MAG: MMPL family transporter [Actinobacteria bacterium]|nr:MMPL family transporter [Actinomycetota bacterium]